MFVHFFFVWFSFLSHKFPNKYQGEKQEFSIHLTSYITKDVYLFHF